MALGIGAKDTRLNNVILNGSSMNPLQLQIKSGVADTRLLNIINELERIKSRQDGGNGISSGEQKILDMAYERLHHQDTRLNTVKTMSNEQKPQQFAIDAIVTLRLEVQLALRLGQFILDNQNGDKVIAALGHQLNNIVPEVT